MPVPETHENAAESRWPVLAAMLGVVGVYMALPNSLVLGPRWLHPTLLIVMLTATVITHRRGNHALNQIFGHMLAGIITFFMVVSLVLWVTNILVFAYWYWRLDGGGPFRRRMPTGQSPRAFLFPQMLMPNPGDASEWSPMFIDYLFVAFNTSAAFSPTDTPVLSRWAKVLTMIQAGVSLTVVVVLAARAIGTV
jgi:hypothetical protein